MTKVRRTSREAYAFLVEHGLLVGKQQRIVGWLVEMGPSTSGEVIAKIGVRNVNAERARFTELQARGLIREVGERRCAISGRTSLVWEATNRTQPLDRKRGHRVNGPAWKALAMDALAKLQAGFTDPPATAALVARAKALGGL